MKKTVTRSPYAGIAKKRLLEDLESMRRVIAVTQSAIADIELELKLRGSKDAKRATEELRGKLSSEYKVTKSALSRACVDTDGVIQVHCIRSDGAGWLVAPSVQDAAYMLKDPTNSFSGVGR